MWHILKFLSLSTDTLYINVINFFAAQKSCCLRHAERKTQILQPYIIRICIKDGVIP